ncbi:unnamed protein product, partial [Mesorhabditis belari]|uniref:Protein kinase domain-containing protein n=1 Tax=Mesorhabditis belari TaxID=2138241 RepID=A0AAF3EW32_9BILA
MESGATISEKRKCLVKQGNTRELTRFDFNLPASILPDTNDSHNRPEEAEAGEFHVLNRSHPIFIQFIAGTMMILENNREVTKRIVVKRIKLENLGFFGTNITKFKEELLRLKFLKNSSHIVQEYRSFYETKDGKPVVFYSITERMDHSLDVYFNFLKKLDGTEKEKQRDHRHISAFLTQTLRALDFLHSQGIVHANLKPSKIGMNKQSFQLKLLDFGKRRRGNLDEEVQCLGIPFYEAPEVIFKGNHSTKMDIWSIGVCAVEFLGCSLFSPKGDSKEVETKIRRFGGRNSVLKRQLEVLTGSESSDTFLPSDLQILERATINPEKLHGEIPYSRLGPKRDPLNVPNLQSLLEKVFEIDPNRRPSATELLKMPYLEIMNRKYEMMEDRFVSFEENRKIQEREKSELNSLIEKDRFYRPPKLSENKDVYHVIASGNFADIIDIGRKDETSEPVKRDLRDIGALLTQLLRALDYIHQRGIIHGDVTPRNIGMNQKEFEIKLLDFGLARETNPKLDHSTNVDTPYIYQPLEVLMKSKYNMAIDIWAVALVAIEMLGMKLFMPTENDQEIERKIRERGAENVVKDRIFEVLGVPNDQYRSIFGGSVDEEPSPNRLNHFLPSHRIGEDVEPLKVVDFLDLISRMLDPNPVTRAKANDCLEHRFLSALPINKPYVEEENKKDREALLNGMRIFGKPSSSNRLNSTFLDPLSLFND